MRRSCSPRSAGSRIAARRSSTCWRRRSPGEHGLGTWNQEGAIQHAQERLDKTLALLRSEGLDATGHVGDMVPLAAIEDALVDFPADMIVISTHPVARSHWLKKDLVESARKKFARPVVHIVSHVSENATT